MLDYLTSCIMEKSLKFCENFARTLSKWGMRMLTAMRSHKFYAFEPVSFILFLSAFALACNTNGLQESGAIWFLRFIMKDLSAASFYSSWFQKPTSSWNTASAQELILRVYN